MSTTTKYTHRFLARFIIEAEAPLAVGSGDKDITTDRLVARDVNDLPFIPATSIAGVIRSMVKEKMSSKDFFGFQEGKDGHGSEIIFTDAQILNSKGAVVDGLKERTEWMNDPLLKEYGELPIRQHVRIGANGAADTKKYGKFDEQVVYAGTRFCFEMEAVATSDTSTDFDAVKDALNDSTFRLGGGTRKGFGAIRIVDTQSTILDLNEPADLNRYLSKSSSLSDTTFWDMTLTPKDKRAACGWTTYELTLSPRDFMLFGSGFGDEDADMTPVRARKVTWANGKGSLTDELVLIPATSVKGALVHRVAFYWNKANGYFAGNAQAKTADNCPAVQALFGTINGADGKAHRGNVIFSDLLIKESTQDKVITHACIDRFTGGVRNGALFTEKATFASGVDITMTIHVKEEVVKEAESITAFEAALKDIATGTLPLGGGTNRGHGTFTGTIHKNGQSL